MTKYKCTACNKPAFKSSRGLSVHFQHNKKCKIEHYKILNMLEITHNINKGTKAMSSKITSTETNKSILKSLINQGSCNEQIEFPTINTETEASNDYNQDLQIQEDLDDNTSATENNYFYAFTNDSRVECNLLKLLFDMGAPKYAFKEVMQWAKNAFLTGYQFNPKSTSFKSQILKLQKNSNLEHL